jgi:hypothetical protein
MVYIWTSYVITTPVDNRLISFRSAIRNITWSVRRKQNLMLWETFFCCNANDLPDSPATVGSWISGWSNTGHPGSSSPSTMDNTSRMVFIEKAYQKFNSYVWFGSSVRVVSYWVLSDVCLRYRRIECVFTGSIFVKNNYQIYVHVLDILYLWSVHILEKLIFAYVLVACICVQICAYSVKIITEYILQHVFEVIYVVECTSDLCICGTSWLFLHN